jgi:hypothetical protein
VGATAMPVNNGVGMPHGFAMHEEWGEMLWLTPYVGAIMAWNPDTDTVREVAPAGSAGSMAGYHNSSVYNPMRQEWASAFGNESDHRGITVVKNDGTIITTTIPTANWPVDHSYASFITYDPISGNYLLFGTNWPTEAVVIEYNPDTNTLADPITLSLNGSGCMLTAVPGLGVNIWITRNGGNNARLYKHNAVL